MGAGRQRDLPAARDHPAQYFPGGQQFSAVHLSDGGADLSFGREVHPARAGTIHFRRWGRFSSQWRFRRLTLGPGVKFPGRDFLFDQLAVLSSPLHPNEVVAGKDAPVVVGAQFGRGVAVHLLGFMRAELHGASDDGIKQRGGRSGLKVCHRQHGSARPTFDPGRRPARWNLGQFAVMFR